MTARDPERVLFVNRARHPHNFSVERLFDYIRAEMPADIDQRNWDAPALGAGPRVWLANIRAATGLQADVYHVTGEVTYLAASLPPARTVITVLDVVYLHRLRGWRRQLLRWVYLRMPVRRAAAVVAISEFTRQEILAYTRCDPAKVHTIHVPISPAYVPAPAEFNGAHPRILMIGTAWNKNLVRQAEALAGISCHVDYVGAPSAELLGALECAGVSFMVHTGLDDEEMHQRFIESDLLLFASTYEGFGMPIVEAQAIGRPVVTGNTASMPDIAGDAACLVDPTSVDSIRAGVRRVIDDGEFRHRIIEAGFRNVRRFDAREIARQYVAIYRTVQAKCSD